MSLKVHLWGPMTHCVIWGVFDPQGKGDFSLRISLHFSQNMQLLHTYEKKTIYDTHQVAVLISDSAPCQSTLVLVIIIVINYESRVPGLPLIVWVYLLSNFHSVLGKMHHLYSRVHNDRSSSSKVDDLHVI